MYAVILRYKVPLAVIETHLAAHRQWVKAQYAAGTFLVSGPQRPRLGGFILTVAMERAALDRILAADPFHANDLADYEVIDVAATSADDRLSFLVEGA